MSLPSHQSLWSDREELSQSTCGARIRKSKRAADIVDRALDHIRERTPTFDTERGGLRRENAALRRMLAPGTTSEFVGESAAIRAVLQLAEKAAAGDSAGDGATEPVNRNETVSHRV